MNYNYNTITKPDGSKIDLVWKFYVLDYIKDENLIDQFYIGSGWYTFWSEGACCITYIYDKKFAGFYYKNSHRYYSVLTKEHYSSKEQIEKIARLKSFA